MDETNTQTNDAREASLPKSLQRRTSEEDTSATAMPSGAANVHLAIAKISTTEPIAQKGLPAHHGDDQMLENHKKCYRCLLVKHEDKGHMTGKKKNIFCCCGYNSIEVTITRLTEGLVIGKMWKDMDSKEKVDFRAEAQELDKAAVRDKLTVLMVQKTLQTESTRTGSNAEYLPMSVYETRGYTKDSSCLSLLLHSATTRL